MMTREQQVEIMDLEESLANDRAYYNTLVEVYYSIKSKQFHSSAEAFYLKQLDMKIQDLKEYLNRSK